VLFEEVARVLDGLDTARVRYWVAGGWGVAVLAGRQTRVHRDLDVAIDAAELDTCLSALHDLGYVVETGWLPVRVELKGPDDVWVDLHPVSFDGNGRGRQAALVGADFVYPPDAFSTGVLRGRSSRACPASNSGSSIRGTRCSPRTDTTCSSSSSWTGRPDRPRRPLVTRDRAGGSAGHQGWSSMTAHMVLPLLRAGSTPQPWA
jgi:lincosamide nucleotidyltransferase A/C/D/E